MRTPPPPPPPPTVEQPLPQRGPAVAAPETVAPPVEPLPPRRPCCSGAARCATTGHPPRTGLGTTGHRPTLRVRRLWPDPRHDVAAVGPGALGADRPAPAGSGRSCTFPALRRCRRERRRRCCRRRPPPPPTSARCSRRRSSRHRPRPTSTLSAPPSCAEAASSAAARFEPLDASPLLLIGGLVVAALVFGRRDPSPTEWDRCSPLSSTRSRTSAAL